jgi:hypothetical protein
LPYIHVSGYEFLAGVFFIQKSLFQGFYLQNIGLRGFAILALALGAITYEMFFCHFFLFKVMNL